MPKEMQIYPNARLNAWCKIENYSKKWKLFLFIKFPFCHLQYLDGIKDATIRLNTKSKTQDNKNTFIQQKETKWKANSRKQN